MQKRKGESTREFVDDESTREIYRVLMQDLVGQEDLWDSFHSVSSNLLNQGPMNTFYDQFLSMERNYVSVYRQGCGSALDCATERRACCGYLYKPNIKRNCFSRTCPTCFLKRLLQLRDTLKKVLVPGTKVITTTVANKLVLSKVEQEYSRAAQSTIPSISAKTSKLSLIEVKVPHVYEEDGEFMLAITLISVVPDDKVNLYCNLVELGKKPDVSMPIEHDHDDWEFLRCFKFPASLLLPGNEESLKQITKHTGAAKFYTNYCQKKRAERSKRDKKNSARRAKYKRKKESFQQEESITKETITKETITTETVTRETITKEKSLKKQTTVWVEDVSAV